MLYISTRIGHWPPHSQAAPVASGSMSSLFIFCSPASCRCHTAWRSTTVPLSPGSTVTTFVVCYRAGCRCRTVWPSTTAATHCTLRTAVPPLFGASTSPATLQIRNAVQHIFMPFTCLDCLIYSQHAHSDLDADPIPFAMSKLMPPLLRLLQASSAAAGTSAHLDRCRPSPRVRMARRSRGTKRLSRGQWCTWTPLTARTQVLLNLVTS